jgi:hypothetical protein
MSRWKMYENWHADLPGLTVDQLIERRDLAEQRARQAASRTMGRNPKAARDWREKRQAVEDELQKRDTAT